MTITEVKQSVKCTLGDCKNKAKYELLLKKSGIKSKVYICENCLTELYSELSKTLVPKSIETIRPKRAKEN